MNKLVILKEAKADLRGIRIYHNNNSKQYSKDLQTQLKSCMKNLLFFPKIGKEFEEFRESQCGNHRIFYELTENKILIARIIDSRMDFN